MPKAITTSVDDELKARQPEGWRRTTPWLLATAFYFGLTIVFTWPLVVRLPVVLASDLGDPLLNTWIIWWNAHAVPLTERWWNGPMFWPSFGVLAFSETLIGLTPITTPIQWLGGSPSTAYNVAFLLTFPLSALAMHALVFRLVGRHDAALIGGLVYGFHPFRVAHFPQIQVMTSYWMPVALLGLHAYVGEQKARWLWISAGAWLMQALSNGYYLIFFPVLAALWMLWFTLSRTRVRMMAAIIGAWAVASLPLVPLLWTYRRILTEYGFQRGIGEINAFSADLVSLLDPPVLLKFWNQSSFHKAEGELFPGMTAALLVLLVVVHWLWKLDRSGRVPRTCLALLLGASVFIAVSLSAVLVGPWSITIGGATLVSVRVVSKPLTIGVLLLVVALGLEPRFVAAWRRRSPLMFYTLAMTMMYVLCFGPEPRFFGVPVMYRAPYSWLMALPGYNAVRVPARFAMLGALCLSVAAALAFGRLTSRSRWSARATLAAFAVAGVLVDSWIAKIPLPVLPPPPQLLASLPAEATVIELPLGDSSDDVGAIYRGMYHRRPVFNGYSGFFPSSYGILREGFGRGDPRMFDIITAATPVVVVLDERRDPGGRWAEQLRNRPGSTLLGQESIWKIFSLPGGAHPREFERSRRLPIPVVSANVHEDRIALVLDGDPNTRWESGPQSGIEVVTIDLGVRRTVEGLSMTIGEHPADFPRMLVIETSDDGREWSTQWTGSAEITAIAGAMHHPGEIPLTFALPEVQARWLRLRQLGEHEIFYWSICELAVFGQ